MDFIHLGNLQGVSSCFVVRDHVGVLDLVRLWLTFGTRRLVAFAEVGERTVRTCAVSSLEKDAQRRLTFFS